MKNLVSRFLKDESGATAIEYGLIAAGIAIAIIAAVQGVGGQLKTNFEEISTTRPRRPANPQVTILAASKAPAEPGPLLFGRSKCVRHA